MTLSWWAALLFALSWFLVGILGLALVLSVRDKRTRRGHTADEVRESVETTGVWPVHPLAPIGAALSPARPQPDETAELRRVDGDVTVLLPQFPTGQEQEPELPEAGWGDPDTGHAPQTVADSEVEQPGEAEADPAVGNPIFDQALRAIGDDAAAMIQEVTSEQPTVEPLLVDAYDVFDDDDSGGGDASGSGGDDTPGGGTTAGRELEVQTAALPAGAAPPAAVADVTPRYRWPQQPARWPAVSGVLPHFMSRRRMVELTRMWQELRRRGEVEVRRVADPAQRLMRQIRADLAERRAAEGREAGAHRADGFRRRPAAA